jgi:ABC-2 type transport system permease protein
MKAALHAEWTKLRTVAAPFWLALCAVATTVAVGAAVARTFDGSDTTRLSLSGVALGQAPIVILAVLTITGEYGSGMIRTTLTATPHRITVLAAKAVALTGVVLATGTVAVAGSLLPARPLPLDEGSIRAAVGSILYLALIALLSLGVAVAVRDSATSVGIVLGLLYLVPIISTAIGDPHWRRLLQQIGPMSAGLTVQATKDLHTLPIGPWAGLGVTAAWAAAALLIGALLLGRRDA